MEMLTTRLGRSLLRCAAIALLAGASACQQGQPTSNVAQPDAAPNAAAAAAPAGAKPVGPAAPAPAKPVNSAAATPIQVPIPQVSLREAPPAEAAAADRRVRIINDSGQTVTLIKGSPSTDSDWGADRIPSGILAAGDSVLVDFDDGNNECVYDLQATLADGSVRTAQAVNICRISDWTVTADE